MAVLGALGAHFWFSIWSLIFFAGYGVLYGSASDSRWHECGHGTAFRTRWMNTAVYNLACFMIMRDPTVWRWSHTRHHTDTIIVGRDPEIIAMRPPAALHLVANFFGVFDVAQAFKEMFIHAAGRLTAPEATFIPDTERHKVYRTARIWLVIYGATVVACVAIAQHPAGHVHRPAPAVRRVAPRHDRADPAQRAGRGRDRPPPQHPHRAT